MAVPLDIRMADELVHRKEQLRLALQVLDEIANWPGYGEPIDIEHVKGYARQMKIKIQGEQII